MSRDLFFDAGACYRTVKAYAAKLEVDATVCGICIAACPWTKKYISGRHWGRIFLPFSANHPEVIIWQARG